MYTLFIRPNIVWKFQVSNLNNIERRVVWRKIISFYHLSWWTFLKSLQVEHNWCGRFLLLFLSGYAGWYSNENRRTKEKNYFKNDSMKVDLKVCAYINAAFKRFKNVPHVSELQLSIVENSQNVFENNTPAVQTNYRRRNNTVV